MSLTGKNPTHFRASFGAKVQAFYGPTEIGGDEPEACMWFVHIAWWVVSQFRGVCPKLNFPMPVEEQGASM
jgi:hypothetical protein